MIWKRDLEQIRGELGRILRMVELIELRVHAQAEAQHGLRSTLDQLLLLQRQQGEQAVGLAALLEGELESEEEREQREKLEKEFEEFQDVMKRLEEV